MAKTTDTAGTRPAGLSPQAVWPPRVRTEPFISVSASTPAEGGVIVRTGPRAQVSGPKAGAPPMVRDDAAPKAAPVKRTRTAKKAAK